MSKTPIKITLTAQKMNAESERDFDAWAEFVAAHIGEALGLTVEVDQFPLTGGPGEDQIDGADGEERAAIRAYLTVYGWEAFCSAV